MLNVEVDVRMVAAASSLESVTAILAGPASPAVKVRIIQSCRNKVYFTKGESNVHLRLMHLLVGL